MFATIERRHKRLLQLSPEATRSIQLPRHCNVCGTSVMHHTPTSSLRIYTTKFHGGIYHIHITYSNHIITIIKFQVYKNQEFLSLDADQLGLLLKSDDLNVTSEESVFDSVMKWVLHDRPNRENNLRQLLELVKLPLLPPAVSIMTLSLYRQTCMCVQF